MNDRHLGAIWARDHFSIFEIRSTGDVVLTSQQILLALF